MLQARITELQKQLARIESGSNDKDNDDFYIPFSELPDLGMQLARLTREFKIQESVFELLTSQYELAKIEEAKDVNTIQVLDRAVPPDKRSKPKRKIMVILSTFVAFFFSVFLAFFLEFVEKVRSEDAERYNVLIKNIKDIDYEKYLDNLRKYKENLKIWIRTQRKK
jgi:tyrosine-protein kinase Etk/Wzc